MAENTRTQVDTNTKLKIPKRYKVVMYNDDFTPMDFVVQILIEIFHKNPQEAVSLMMTVHKGNQAIVGSYSYDIAMTKREQAVKRAREEGYPFRIEVKS